MGNVFSRSKKQEYVYVHFNKKKFRVLFTAEDLNADKQVPLQQFRTKLAKVLNVPALSLTLYQQKPQKKLENMSATLQDYGIKTGADILAIQETAPQRAAPLTPSQQIGNILNEVDTKLSARIAQFVDATPSSSKEREDEHRILGETILAKTIELDNVEVEQAEERRSRKEAIGKLQRLHKTIDEAKERAESVAGSKVQSPTSVAPLTTEQNSEALAPKHVASEAPSNSDAQETSKETPKLEPVQVTEPVKETPQVVEPVKESPQVAETAKEMPQVAEPVKETPQVAEPVEETPQVSETVRETLPVSDPLVETSNFAETDASQPGEVASAVHNVEPPKVEEATVESNVERSQEAKRAEAAPEAIPEAAPDASTEPVESKETTPVSKPKNKKKTNKKKNKKR